MGPCPRVGTCLTAFMIEGSRTDAPLLKRNKSGKLYFFQPHRNHMHQQQRSKNTLNSYYGNRIRIMIYHCTTVIKIN